MSTIPTDQPAPPNPNPMATYLIVAACSIFFCSKGVFVKSAYALGADPLTVLALRMLYALPFFMLAAIWASRGKARLERRQWQSILWLSFIGYYFSAVVNFTGLQYITVGLERMVLYTYPSLILLGSAFVLRKKVEGRTVLAMLVAYAGIAVGFSGEVRSADSMARVALGVGLVFSSAISYAIFVIGSGKLIAEIGATRFTSHVVGVSCLMMLFHWGVKVALCGVPSMSPGVHGNALVLAVFGTVIPSFLLGIGLRRAGVQRFAIIGTVGPLATIVLAWLVLGEALNLTQILGFVLAMTGGLMVSLWK